jgi:hypothetical protein
MKYALMTIVFVFCGCAHDQLVLKSAAERQPAQAQAEGQGQNISFVCQHGASEEQESFQVSSDNAVKYNLLTKNLPMEARGPIASNWISKNVLVLSGRWISDMICGPPSSCEYRYFTIYLHKVGSGLEITTYYRHPENTWKSESTPVTCKVSQ